LQEVTCDLHFQLWFPLLDERRHDFMKEGPVPLMDYLRTLRGIASRPIVMVLREACIA
jgi:hypothetical protein